MLPALLLAGLLAACNQPEPRDTGSAPSQQQDQAESPSCDELELRVDGPDPPHVGESWTAWLWCDDTLLTGVTVLRFDPADIASVDGNTATFLHPGDASMRLQVGGYRAERDPTVLPADSGGADTGEP